MLATCYRVPGGCKCLHRDINLKVIKGPAKADPEGGLVQSVSEVPCKFLEIPLSIMPSGAFVAGYEKKPGEPEIILWERNGLKHGSFQISEEYKEIKQLEWTLDASCLAASFKSGEKAGILIFNRMNYKWYNKLCLLIPEDIWSFKWLSKKGRMLFVRKSGVFTFTDFDNVVHTSTFRVQAEQDFAGCAVIDGKTLFISHFDKTVIPPPWSNYQITLPIETAPLKLCFSQNWLACLDYKNIVLLPTTNYSTNTILILPEEISKEIVEHSVTQFLFLQHKECNYAILHMSTSDPVKDRLVFIEISNENKIVKVTNTLTKKIHTICPNAAYSSILNEETSKRNSAYFSGKTASDIEGLEGSKYIFVQYQDKVIGIATFDQVQQDLNVVQQPFVQMTAAYIGIQEGIIGITANMKLYINSILFSSDVTSYLISGNFLLFTKSTAGMSHLIYIFDLANILPFPLVPNIKNYLGKWHCDFAILGNKGLSCKGN